MKEELITFETSKLAYEKGYTREVVGISFTSTRRNYYNTQGELNGDCIDFIKDVIKYGREKAKVKHIIYPATSQSLLQKWLRDEKDILIYVGPRSHHIFQYHIITDDNEIIGSERLNNWEKTLEKGLQEALKLI